MKQLKLYLLFLTLFAILGFTRDFFFVNLNNIMYGLYYKHETLLPIPASMRFFLNYSYDTLYYSKYFFTLLFTGLFFLVTYLTLKMFKLSADFIKILVYTYLILISLAALSQLYGYFLMDRLADDEYTLSRWLMGIAQSPIICLILVASEKLYNTTVKRP